MLTFNVNRNGLETDFSVLKNPVAILYTLKKIVISIKEGKYKQEEFYEYLEQLELEVNLKNKKKNLLITF